MKKTPIVMQLEALECGAASLAMVMAYYNKWVALEQVRIDCGVSRDGSNAKNILAAARNYGFIAKGYAFNTKALKEKMTFPCIIHWNKAHFVVLNGFKGNKAYINDPAKGFMKVGMEQFEKSYTGICLEIKPGENFVPSGKRKSMSQFAKKRLAGAISLVVFFSLTIIIAHVIGIFNQILRQVFVDTLLDGNNPEWLLPFIIVASIICFLQLSTAIIDAIYKYKIKGKLALVGSSNYMWKLLRLPISFFSQRMAGDLQHRKSENASIAETLVNVFAPIVFNSLMLILYLVVMLSKSVILTALGVSTILLNAILSYFISSAKINIARVHARDNALLIGLTSKGIEMIETIKSSGAENNYFYTWNEAQENASNQKLKIARISQLFGIIPAFLLLLVNYGILIIGVYLTIEGKFTIGSILAFQGLLSAFLAPALMMINSGQTIQEMRTQMERIDDVMEYSVDPNIDCEIEGDYDKLGGNLEINHITFGYNKLSNPVITDFSLKTKQGDVIAIVGESGSGKSTLSKLVSGLYQVWDGDILYDGKPIEKIDHEVFVASVAVVDQDIVLFNDTIENNIKMWDQTISDEDMIQAAKDAMIYDVIMNKSNGFKEMLLEGGKNLSGGERQRIEIARALVSNPSLIILDEATSALDAKTEYDVVQAIKSRGITCLIIAHRLSTIKDADNILVLYKGNIIEQGKHEELMHKAGYYFDLIRNE